jgi:hypothetical protein
MGVRDYRHEKKIVAALKTGAGLFAAEVEGPLAP